MARAYSTLKRYAEGLSLTQSAHIRLREARYQLSLLTAPSIPEIAYFPLADEPQLISLESDLNAEELKLKCEWFAYNGGTVDGTEAGALKKKPLFYDIAFNSVNLPMDRLLARAGRAPAPLPTPVPAGQPTKAKIDEPAVLAVPEPEEPAPAPAPARGGLSSLLGGWWGRR
jgi:signal recognition particle subunit SRP68